MKDKIYVVEIDRISRRRATFTINAPTESVAEDLALAEASNHNYLQESEYMAKYEIIELDEMEMDEIDDE